MLWFMLGGFADVFTLLFWLVVGMVKCAVCDLIYFVGCVRNCFVRLWLFVAFRC